MADAGHIPPLLNCITASTLVPASPHNDRGTLDPLVQRDLGESVLQEARSSPLYPREAFPEPGDVHHDRPAEGRPRVWTLPGTAAEPFIEPGEDDVVLVE